MKNKKGEIYVFICVFILCVMTVFSVIFTYASIITTARLQKTNTQVVFDSFVANNSILIFHNIKQGKNATEGLNTAPFCTALKDFWMKNERLRETSYLSFDEIREELWSISKNLYYNHSYEISTDDTAITGLLKYSDILEKNVTGEFYHHSLCAFFLADSVYNAIRKGDKLIIEALCIPLKNDVTDFVRSAISGSDQPEIKKIQQNLKEAYIQIDDLEKNILSKKAKDMIREMSEEERFVIKNELIYLMTRIPDPTKTIPAFLEDIHAKNRDPYILLDIAYAATLTGPTQIALDYAKTLSPDSPNGLINRSWTIAYFGDVQANPHIYKDTEKAPWRKSREARLKRFQSSSFKALRFRILDFPLLYCFYVDREWRDVNEKDYKIIEKTDIENAVFSDDERLFLKQKKSQLLQGFKNHLLNNEVHSEWTPTSEPQVFDCG